MSRFAACVVGAIAHVPHEERGRVREEDGGGASWPVRVLQPDGGVLRFILVRPETEARCPTWTNFQEDSQGLPGRGEDITQSQFF